MKKYLFAFDLDGSLLNSKGKITQQSQEGIEKIRSMGHEVCIITGRGWNLAKEYYHQLGLTTPLGIFNGGVVYSPNDDNFDTYMNVIPTKLIEKAINLDTFKKHSLNFTLESFDMAYREGAREFRPELQEMLKHRQTTPFDGNLEDKEIIGILGDLKAQDGEEAKRIVEQLIEELPEFDITYWYSDWTHTYTVEFVIQHSRKDFALKAIANYLHIPIEDTFAFGDGHNDKHMLINSGTGIAMQNAASFVKEYANQVTRLTNDEDGIIDHIFNEILKQD